LFGGHGSKWTLGRRASERTPHKLERFLRIDDPRKVLADIPLLVPNGSAPMARTQVASFEPKAKHEGLGVFRT